MTVTEKTRNQVHTRDGGCIVPGVTNLFGPCFGSRTVQHTVGRGMGGSDLFDTADLLISMCNYHNSLLTSDARFARFGRARGWVRDRNSRRDPRLVPVLYSDGWHRLVGIERVPVPAADALEYMHGIGAIRTVEVA
jgi:hypothetical protein